MKLKIKKTDPRASIPSYATEESAGFDLSTIDDVVIEGGETILIGTGLSLEIPKGYYVQIFQRSGLSLRTGFRLANSVGVIDSDFRGELKIIGYLMPGSPTLKFKSGDRIAQAVLQKYTRAVMTEVDELEESLRGQGGFGSTDKPSN